MIIDDLLQDIQPSLSCLVEAEQTYCAYREKLVGDILREINQLQTNGNGRTNNLLRERSGQRVRVVRGGDNYIGCLNLPSFSEGVIDGFARFEIKGEKFSIEFDKEIEERAGKLAYEGVRKRGAIFYEQFLEQKLGEDFKGVFLFSAGDPISFRTDFLTTEPAKPLGHWDYVDNDFRYNGETNLKTIRKLKSYGIENPEVIIPYGGSWHSRIDTPGGLDCWRRFMHGNKSTRLIGWGIGKWNERKNSVPPELEVGNYDVVYSESNQIGDSEDFFVDLAKPGGYIVLGASEEGRRALLDTGKVKPLLLSPDMDDNLFQKISL